MNDRQDCCQTNKEKSSKGVWQGIVSGLIPHTFCILFIAFTLFGSVFGATIAKKFLLIPHFFLFLVILSFIFATLSAWLYLRKCNYCSANKLKTKWKYLTMLYGLTLIINIVFIYLIFPAIANTINGPENNQVANQAVDQLTIKVDIPCSGHAPLIIDEVKKSCNIQSINYQLPNVFEIKYDPKITSAENILSLAIFKTYKIIN